MIALRLKVGQVYHYPSGMGGVFRCEYLGKAEGKYQFKNIHPGWEGPIYLASEERLADVKELV